MQTKEVNCWKRQVWSTAERKEAGTGRWETEASMPSDWIRIKVKTRGWQDKVKASLWLRTVEGDALEQRGWKNCFGQTIDFGGGLAMVCSHCNLWKWVAEVRKKKTKLEIKRSKNCYKGVRNIIYLDIKLSGVRRELTSQRMREQSQEFNKLYWK